jgi:hypothetical protein
MTARLPFTEARIERAVRGARAAGLEIGAIAVRPDGTIMIFSPVDNPVAAGPIEGQDSEPSKWADVKA